MFDTYKAIIIEVVKDSSDTGKGVIAIGLIAIVSIAAIKEILAANTECRA